MSVLTPCVLDPFGTGPTFSVKDERETEFELGHSQEYFGDLRDEAMEGAGVSVFARKGLDGV